MDIGFYEDWMKPQVAKLFCRQYGVTEESFSQLLDNFYELPFQKDKCIRIVAREKDTIIGFQSFFYWPYTMNGETFRSYQSGNSLVHPDHRGKGVFQKLLNYLELHRKDLQIDFLIGFPIQASIGSLLRNNWINLFNLQWYMKVINPFSVFIPLNKKILRERFPNLDAVELTGCDQKQLRIMNSASFTEWRSTHYDKEKYYTFQYSRENKKAVFKLKTNIRKKVIKELIIGDICTTSYELGFLDAALTEFLLEVKKISCVTLVSIALNPTSENTILEALLKKKFKKINKQIFFCIKPFSEVEAIQSAENWIVYRGDIDTW